MKTASDFSLAVVANVCAGPASLRDRLTRHGLDTQTIGRLVNTSPLTVARATKGGATPRGVLIGMATLVTLLQLLSREGLDLAAVGARHPDAETLLDDIASGSTAAALMIDRLRKLPLAPTVPAPAQLSFDRSGRIAA